MVTEANRFWNKKALHEMTVGEWEARDLHRKFTEELLRPLRPLL